MQLLQIIGAALRYGTRYHGPANPPAHLLHSALSLQPLTGFACGLFAAIPVLFICHHCLSLQGFLIFSSFIYLLLSEWVTRFHGLHELTRVSNALKTYHILPGERLAYLENGEQNHIGDSVCTIMCLIAKALLLYLIVLRLGLFHAILPLGIILTMVPALSRAMSLYAFPTRGYAERNKMPVTIYISTFEKVCHLLFWYFLLALALACVSAFGETLFSFTSWEKTLENLSYIFTNFRKSANVRILFLRYFIQSSILLFPAVYLPILYWTTESYKKCGRLTCAIEGPIRETAEVVLFMMCLLEADLICF